ncbi:MAG TPA: restriction endonuclease subunit S [Candidatus Uhrbacteria bacterium]|nr:restriction endonuclease subunit S [Candidatus Uhrbacteria bacterium]
MTANNNKCFAVLENELEGRIDPHFYSPIFNYYTNKLKRVNYKNLGDIIDFSNEIWNQKDYFDKEFPYIEISKIDINTGEIKDIIYYDKEKAPSRAKMIVRDKDIIVSTTRPSRGAIAFINKSKDGFIASTGFAILRDLKNKAINKDYLFYFLRTKFSLNQMEQRSSGGNYPAITTEELKKIIIPIPPLKIQNQIVEIMQKAYKDKEAKEKQADELFNSIDDYVLGELGIKMPELEDKKCFSVDSEDIKNQRIAPDYYQPRFTKTEKAIKNAKYKIAKLKDVLEYVKKGIEVGSKAYTDEGIPFVRVADIDDLKIDIQNTDKKIAFDLYQELKNAYKPKTGELLYSKDGSIGFCAIVEENDDFITSGGILRLKINDKFNSYYIKTLLSSKLFKIIAGQKSIGAIIKHLLPEEILNFQIPLPPFAIQNKIASEVKKRIEKSEKLKLEGQKLVEEAKSEVEKIILGK